MPNTKLVYEWVKTGHWTYRQFSEWVQTTLSHSKAEERERSILCLERNADKPIYEIISAIRALKD